MAETFYLMSEDEQGVQRQIQIPPEKYLEYLKNLQGEQLAAEKQSQEEEEFQGAAKGILAKCYRTMTDPCGSFRAPKQEPTIWSLFSNL